MSERYKVRSIILCDDARQEVSGKDILIGVYGYSIVFAQFPAAMPQLILRISIDIKDKTIKKFSAHVKDPNGSALGQFSGDTSNFNYDEPITLGFIMAPLMFYTPGRYTIDFALDDDPIEIISDFVVRLPKNENESRRVPARIA